MTIYIETTESGIFDKFQVNRDEADSIRTVIGKIGRESEGHFELEQEPIDY